MEPIVNEKEQTVRVVIVSKVEKNLMWTECRVVK